MYAQLILRDVNFVRSCPPNGGSSGLPDSLRDDEIHIGGIERPISDGKWTQLFVERKVGVVKDASGFEAESGFYRNSTFVCDFCSSPPPYSVYPISSCSSKSTLYFVAITLLLKMEV